MRRGRIHGEKNMRNSRTKTQTKLRNYIKLTAGALLLAITFVLVFAGTLSGAFGIESDLQQNGIIQSNVASAAVTNKKSSLIDLSATLNAIETSYNINPDPLKRGKFYTTNADNAGGNNWTTTKWTMGSSSGHTGTDYAHCWIDYDLGDWLKLSDRIDITVSVGAVSMSKGLFGGIQIGGYFIAIDSSDTQFQQLSNASSDGSNYYDKQVKERNDIDKSSERPTGSFSVKHTIKGRYIRIYLVSYSSTGDYGTLELSNVSVDLTRTKKSYSVSYDKNADSSTGTVANTSHKYMAASNITSDFYVGNGQYFTGWNTNANGSGIAMAIGASTGTSTAANTFGNVVRSNLQNGQTTTTLYAQYQGISFTFNGKDYTQYNNEVLQVLQGRGGYLTHTVDSSYSTVVSYRNSNGSEIDQPITIGVYSAIIEVSKDGKTRGTVTLPFEIIEGDFGKIQGGTGKWGSVTNPYVISNETHLKNLSAIVNGRDALNSIVGSNNNSVTAEDVVATDKTYKDCYFVVAADLGTGDAPIAFVPIGKDSTHYFAGTIFGGNDSDANNRTMRTISLNIQSGDVSNVGLFGYVKGATISHLTTAGTIVGGAAVGGLVGYADGVTISNCRNNATVTGAYMIGGFVGFGNNVTITSSVNNADITGEYNKAGTPSGLTKGAYVGGFVGVVNGGSIANCYNNGNISASGDNSDFLGGIAGYTTAPISYCASLKDKTIEGSNQVGGIVGKASGNNAKIEYCYFGGKINGLWNDNSAKLDFICAEKEDGSSVSNSWKLSSAMQGATGNRQYTNAGHSIQASAFTLSPSYFDGTEYTPYTAVDGWQNILTVNINAFQILGGTESGKFLALHDGSNKSTLPNKTVIGKEKNSTGSPAKTDLVVNFIVYYNADTKQDVVAELKDIKIDAAAVDYNATEQYVVDNTQLPTTVNTDYFKQSFYFDQNGGGNATLGKTNAGTYKVYSDVWIRANNTDYLVGRKESTWAIKKLKFTIGNNQFFYGQDIENAIKNQIVIKNQSNVSVPKEAYTVVFGFNDTEHNFYGSIDIDQNQKEFSVAKTIISIYDSSNTLINDNFDINGFSVIVKAGDFGVQNNGINKSNIENNPWGSESNPYIIGTRGQLVTLSNIVRGVTNATNSWYTSDVYKYVKGTIASYGGAYFKLARSLTSIGNITPIGTSSNVFAATFDGNNNNLSGLNISVAGNNVGLFGYISGATIKNLTVNGSVKGSSNVGGVVGYALNSTIENVTNNASISSTYKDAPYEIKQFDAHPYDSTTQAVSKVNDGDLSSKYYSAKKGAMSFIVQNTTLAYIFGFAITNADDTNNTAEIQKRTPQSVKIWGSNNDFTRGDYDTGGGNTTVPNEWGWEVVYDSTLAMPSTNSYRKEFFSGFKLRNYKYYYIYVKAADNYSTLQFAEFDLLTTNSQNVGGVVGYAQGTSINKATNTASVEGDTSVGGIVGYADSTSRMYGTIVNSGNITANSMVGGVSGENHGFWCDTNSNYGTFKNSGSINGRNGATVGGVTAFADKEMCNAENTGNVIGGNAVGGVAGRVQAPIKNSYNSGEIVGTNPTAQGEISGTPTGVFVGGITGYTTVNGTISHCYNKGHIAAHSASGDYINNGDYVGGIVGFAQAKVEYCANIGGLIEGNNFIGGIVGSALDNTNIDYCYDVQGQRKFRWDGCNHGSITGSGGNVTNSWAINEKQAQTTANNPNPVVSTKGYRLTTAFAVTPQVDLQNTTNQKWEDILSSKINGFKVVGSVAKNEFFCSDNGSDTNTKYVKPSKTEGFAGDNGDVTAWYSATIESNIRVRVQNIDIDNKSSIYDNAEHTFDFTLKPSQSANSANVYAVQFAYLGRNYGEFVPKDVDVYDTTITVKIGDQVVGVKTGVMYTIEKAALNVGWEWTDKLHANLYDRTGNGDKVQFVYNGKAQGLDSVSEHLRDVQLFDVTGNDLTNTNAATYTRTYTLKDTRNYKLQNANNNNADLSGTTVTFEWKIRKNKLTVFNRWVAEDFGKDSNLYTFEYNTTHRGLLATNDAITFLTEKATDNTRPEFKQGTDYTISEHQNAINVGEYSRTVRIINTNYEVNNTTAYVGSSNNATVNKGISVNGLVVTYTWKIVPYSLATNITSGNVWFGGRTDLIVGNQGIANVEGDTTKSYYPLQADKKGAPGVQQVLVYAQHNYTADKFVLYVKYNNGIVAELKQGTDKEYTVGTLDTITNTVGTFNVNVVSQASPVVETNVTASGTGNFSGNITKYYTAMFSDFGWKDGKTPEDNDWGGSADNPYVISKPEHLLRLSQIVNGGMAWNSIQNTVTAGVCIAPQTTAKATSRDYKDAYFLVTADIDMTGNVSTDGVYNFLPIGHRNEQSQTDMPFSGTFDGNGKKIKFVYNVNRNNFYNNNKAHSDYVGLFGYIAGYKVDAEQKYATIKNLSIESMDGNEVDDKGGIIGKDYVGGIAGYAVDSKLYNVSMMYGGWVRGENYVGGIVGYADNTWLKVGKDYDNAITNANVAGMQYVGGIVGNWIVRSEDQIGGDAAGQAKITLPSGQQIHGVKYVGGIAGWLDTSSCTSKVEYTPQLNNNGEKVGVYGTEYVGALFGAFIGNGYHQNATNDKYTAIVIDKDANNFKVGNVKVILQNLNEQSAPGNAKVVGGLVGYAEGVGILFNTDWTTSNVTLDTGNYTPSFIGGIAGVLGKNATIESKYQLKDDGTFLSGGLHTITHSVPDKQTFGTAAKPLGSFVGGIVGYVSSQAGVYWETGTTIFGNGISLVNLATIYATSYAGGIFGALGDLSTSVAQTFENDTNSILYNVLTTGVRSGNASTTLGLAPTGNGITAQGRLVNNASISVSGSYVGGIAGYGGAKVRFVLRNTPQDSAIDVSKLNIYSGGSDIFINGSYAGGIAGYLADNLEHELQYIVVQAKFDSANAKRVGGLVGYMGSGKVERCVVTSPDGTSPNGTISAKTDNYQGSEYVGGLVGETQNATIRNSVSTGFNLEKTSNTKGGLLGYGANPTIDSSWTFYIANSGATYSTVSKNTYGKYILVDTDIVTTNGSSYPTFAKLCEFTGITKNGTAGVLEFAVNVPSQEQLVFYNASGSDTETSNKESFKGFENRNNVLTIKLDMASGTSMQICLLSVRFVNVPKCSATSTEQDKIDIVEATYVKPSNSTRYHVKATTADFDTTGTSPTYQVTHIVANIFFDYNGDMVYIGTAESSEKTGSYDSGTLTPGHETNPYTISTRQEWEDFAASVNDGSFKQGSYVKLLNDITISTLAGNSSNSFSGTFDGNGHTINLGTRGDNADGTSLFPYAYSAVFRNLSIDGTITNTSREGLAGFVGIAKGKLEFYNCTNNVKVTAFRNAAGFTGFVSTYDIIFTSCVNNGDIETKEGADNSEDSYSPIYYTYGTGGIIACIAISGNSARSFTIKSCINNGNITAPVNVGGIVGKISGNHSGDTISARCDLYMYDCANTGEIYSNQKLTDDQAGAFWDLTGDNKYYGRTIWCNAGGLVGIVFKSAALHLYSSYNSGYVHGIGNVVGGLVGSIGDHNGQTYRTPNSRAMYPSEIYYCFNTGRVEVGYDGVNTSNGINIWGKSGDKYCSAVVGGLVGVMSYGTIAYSYNTGTVDCWGGVGVKAAYNSRAGGIIGESTANAQVNWTRNVTVKNCYNVGQINVYTKEDARYASGIVGYMDADNAVNNTHVSNCYSVTNAVYYRQTNIYIDELIFGGDEKWTISGTLSDLSGLTAKMNDKGVLTTTFAEGSGNDASIESLTDDTKYINGTAKGYIYIYGCLPQLAVFALDTHDALSMRSVGFGQDQYGEFNNEAPQNTGSETYPYIIRDGIGLLGVQALVDLGYDFDNEYIEFANSTNNIKADGSTSSNSPLVCTSINMPKTDEQNTYLSATAGYYMSSSNGVTYNQAGKSYHLFALGAVCRSTPGKSGENSNDSFNWWIGNNHYYNGAYGNKEGAYKNYATFKTQNILTIGRNGNVFKGSISGKQENNANTVINNLRITSGQTIDGAYGGLFGHVENAYIGYIEVGGESNIWAYSSDNQQIAATGAIAGYVTGDSIIEHCAVSGTTAIGAYGKNDNTHIASDITYAGGIVGLTDPKQGSEYKAGISAIIKGCTVNISTTTGDRAAFAGIIQACKSNIGGVLGYIEGIGHIKVDGDDNKDYGASGKSNSVRIEGCEVQKAAIQAASSATESSHIGGVLGYGSEYVAAFITGCKVGNGADTVTIKGEHSLGGIAGGMSNAKGGYIDSCIVGEKAIIERINQGGDKDDNGDDKVSENPKHGTAIGGLVGFTEDSTDTTSPLTTTFSGTSAFGGTITVSVEATNKSQDSDAKISCIGGIVGDMGSGANFASGSNVTVGGNINITLAAANVGGVVGRTNKATFIGKFNVAPNMSTENAENVGGFIGKNVGTVYILADTTERIVDGKLNGTNITIGGTIQGTSEVGGFIGVNNSGSSLNIGSNVANAKPYRSGTLSITIENGTITGGDNVGGIVGKNEGADGGASYAIVDIVKGTIKQKGAIIGANNVGGIIGLNDGLLTTGGGEADTSIGGVTLSEEQQNKIKNLSINNTGSVTGTGDYVGGVVGKLDSPATLRTEDLGKGAIAGTFTNSGTVVGNSFVGGSLGFVGKNVTITAKNNVATLFVNDGEVNATGYFVGGSIGALVGKIQGENSSVAVKFENKKKVKATGFVGGSIGVLAGPVSYAQFVNSSDGLEIAAVNSVGGSVGYIGVPSPLSDELVGFTAHQIDINNTHFEASGNLTANPSQDAINAAKKDKEDNGWGGVGGAIGVMGAAIKSWTDNTYYANGNVEANVIENGIETGIYNVGGIVGLINASNITISNMLAYRTTVTGGKNVGGIVGATTGAKTVINSAYAIEGTFTGSKNVGGIIGLAKTDTDASTSYWVKGYANSDIATYDVKDLSKLGFTTGKAITGWFFLYANDATGANGLGTINTSHSTNSDLQYWKRIADAYTAQERADGDDKKTIAPPSDIVSGGQPQHATLYATATAAEVTEKGYYMYTATSNNDVKPSVIYDNGVYYISVKTNVINAEDEKVQAQNVAVFYRSVSSSKEALIYNGYLRNAIIGLDGVYLYENPIGDNETPTINGYKGQYIFTATTTIKNADGSTSEVNEAQSDPNTYSSVIKIYYVDDNGTARLVGGNTELAWKITERELAVAFEHTTNRTYGTGTEDNTTDMTVTIDNIAPKRGVTVPIRIVVSYGTQEDSRVIFTWDGTKFNGADENIKLTSLPMTPSGTLSDKDKESTSETIEDEATYQLVVKLFFKQAKSYTITVLDSSQKARYTFKKNGGSASAEVSDEFTVLPAPLTLRRGDNVAASSAYDGTAKGTAWVVEGFKYNDGIQQFSEFAPSFNIAYKNSGAITKAMTAENMTTGVDFNGPRVTVSGPTGGDLTITLSNAIKKGDYYLSFGKYKAGNYVLTADDSVRSYSIVEIQITISCADNGKSKVYNGQTQTIEISFVASVPSGSGITDFEGIENFAAFISEFFNIKEGDFTVTKPSNTGGQKKEKEVKWTITTGKNAKEYKFEFEKGNKYNEHIQNCSHKPETLPTYKYTITRRPLTLTTTLTEMPNGASQYTYNTSHQGLSKIKVDNLVANDTIGVTIKIGTQSATVELENNNAKDVTDKVSTIDAGTYSVSFALSTNTSYPQNENYTLTATDVTWKIDKYKIMIGEFEIGAEKTYNAEAEVPKINVTNSEVSVSGNTFTYGTDTFTLEYAVSYNNQTYASNNLVNAGTYKIKIGTSNGKIHAKHSDGNDASNNYEFGNSSTEHQYVINPCEIKIGWEKKTFVYNASNWKLNVASIEINNKTKTVTNNRVQTGLGNDTLTFSRGGGGIDVGSYTTVVTSHSVSVEPNHGVRPIAGNYKIVSGATSGEFTITPFVVNISFNTSAGAILNKVYNANEDVPKEQIKDSYFTWSKISGTNLPSSNPFTITGKYYDKTGEHYDKNVGTGKCVMFTYTFTDPSGKGNYKAGTVDTAQHNVGQITPAHIKVALDKLRSGKATRTFTNDVWYGGEAGASGNGNSEVYRSGEGFTISGVFSSDDIKVVAKYAEAGDDRAMFDKYVNDVEKNENTFTKVASGTHLKMLVFEMTGKDATNYTFNVYDTSDKAYSKNNGDSQTPVNVYDKDDEKNNKDKLSQIKIEITVKTYKVEYTNAAQSYANADNTYNTNWERVGVSNNPPGVTVTVSNGWMYADGQDHGDDEQAEKKVYKAYTTIRGSQNSVRLGAKISGIDGMELNYKMVNQPILTIGYFVVDNNDVFEIGSASSLMIASYYWWVAQNGQNPDFNLPLVATSTWHKIVSNDDYMTKPFEKPSDAPNNVDMSEWDWDMYFAWFEQQNNVKIFLNETGIPNEDGTWGYYTTGEESQKKQYTKYRMVRDFSGKLSESDIAILEAFFPKDKGWGVGKTYLDNFLNTSVGSVLTAVGSVFRWYNGSVGQFEFDGNGYVIEYLNIMGYDNENVGLFDVIGANGIVKNLHLRNITINANKGNVGGIAGSIAAAEGDADATKNVTNVSFHGKITATGGTVGGLFGTSARAIDGAIVLGEISATNAIVGGVVGTATAGLNNVVSMMQITASGGTVGAFTSDNANVGEKCTHMTKAVWKKGTSGTGFVNVKDKNVGYNALMSGSNSLYANGTSDLGTYDVISETFADSGQNVNPRQSKRLRDMVSVYLLMYSLSVNGEKYTISSSSWLVGTADGTNAKPIVIANKQNVSLLRELRFAAFMLKANVSIDIASTFSGAFYGSVTSETDKNYKITCNKPMFEAYATEPTVWLVTPTQP